MHGRFKRELKRNRTNIIEGNKEEEIQGRDKTKIEDTMAEATPVSFVLGEETEEETGEEAGGDSFPGDDDKNTAAAQQQQQQQQQQNVPNGLIERRKRLR